MNYNNLNSISYNEFQKTENLYDCIVTFSSIEHSGLGRYGDPLNPNGDIESMKDIHKNLKDNGILLWGAPVGKDTLVWNAHRIYGYLRLPLIFENFKEIEWLEEYDKKYFLDINYYSTHNFYQPVVVLQK